MITLTQEERTQVAIELAALRAEHDGAELFLALFNGNPMRRGREVRYSGYQRALLGRRGSAFAAVSAQVASNANTTVFPVVTGEGAYDITHWAVFDANDTGAPIIAGRLQDRMVLTAGLVPAFPAGNLRIKLDAAERRA
jgi:hypothetical protein